MIKFLFFITNLLKIFSYIPTTYKITDNDKNVYLRDTCTCDLTYKVCDRNCCCDPDCDFSKYGIFEDFFEECIESNVILPDSVNLVPICSIEPFVIGDLYNPLSVGYQLLKKGMCLNDKYQELDDNRIKNPEKVIKDSKVIENDNEQIDSENIENVFINDVNNNEVDYENIEKRIESFIFPVMDPSGMCMKGYPIKPGEDKIVICSIQSNTNERFNDEILKYVPIGNFRNNNQIIIKVEILIIINQKPIINLYSKNETINNTTKYIDVTFVVKFFSAMDNQVFPVPKNSGNSGYLIGSPIRFGSQYNQDSRYIIPFIRSRLFICKTQTNIYLNNDTLGNNNFYEDFILSNSITFENRTLFTCEGTNNPLTIQDLSNYLPYILLNGNSVIDDSERTQRKEHFINECTNQILNANDYNILSVKIFYEFIGLKQNPQRNIIKIECDTDNNEDKEIFYIEFLFIKKNEEIIKKEVPAPYIIRWPQNWLYPFRIGETDYED